MSAKTHIATWGSSLAVRIPKPIAEQWGVHDGSAVEIFTDGDDLVLRREKFNLAELVSKITPENLHGEVDTGAPQGNEAW
jgi:antitoxin MazE